MNVRNKYEHDEQISEEEVMNIIGRLKCGKSSDLDGITADVKVFLGSLLWSVCSNCVNYVG